MQNENFNFSLILRTYNPDLRLMKRCLQSILELETKNLNYEVILVDNNSNSGFLNNIEIKNILSQIKNLQIIIETKPGSNNASLAGVKIANAPWLVFFDQDNEPYPDYLIKLKAIVEQHNNVGIWGPGEVIVDFIDKTSDWIEKNCRETFQEKKTSNIEYASELNWNKCYPPGTGYCVKKEIFLKYTELYLSKSLKTIARSGTSLMGAEDSQVIYMSILLGYSVGTHPALKLKHIIPEDKSNFDYVKKLRFFTRYSFVLATIEMLPETLNQYEKKQISQASLFILLNKYLIKGILNLDLKNAIINTILVAGNYTGINYALKKRNPVWLLVYLKTIGIKIE